MSKTAVPEHILENLKCTFCTEYLSVAPIYTYYDSIRPYAACGRCPIISDQNPVRNEPYEILASTLKYPCKYKPYGCLQLLTIELSQLHEEECSYRQYFCPRMPLGICPWQGSSAELYEHFADVHDIYILRGDLKFEIDFVNKYDENCLIEKNGSTFLLQTRCDIKEQNLLIYVRYIGAKANASKYVFTVTLQSPHTHESISLPHQTVGDDIVMTIDESKAAKVGFDYVLSSLDNPAQVVCLINIDNADNVPEVLISIEEQLNNMSILATDDRLLRKLECPACLEYMVPPIHQCLTGHSICAICRSSVSECPICKGDMGNTRNFTLEDMAEDINYPCKYAEFGCAFSSGHKEIKPHESQCKHGPYDCPIACGWKGKLNKVMEHVRSRHEDTILEFEEISMFISDQNVTISSVSEHDCRILNKYGSIFKIDFKNEDSNLYWSVQYFGPIEDFQDFSYELDFSSTIGDERIYFKKKCTVFTKGDPFEEGKAFLKLPYDLLKDYIDDDQLTYKCIVSNS